MKDILVFYHLFTVNEWEYVFKWHLEQLRTSGLYEVCKQIHVGVVYEDRRSLSKLNSILRFNTKAVVCLARELNTSPVIWNDPEVRLNDGRLGECETMLHMTEYAQRYDREVNYLFFHSKGVTNPPTKRRKHLPYFVGRGFDPSESNEMANAFVLRDTSTVVSNWVEYVEALETSSFWYYIYNFFWVRGDLLHHFNFDEYLRLHRELAPPQQRSHRLGVRWNMTRHLFSLFPIKLYAFRYGIEMDQPTYSYINVKM